MKINTFLFSLGLLLLSSCLNAQGENKLLDRSFWKESPSVEMIETLIKEGHSPTKLTIHGFDAVTYAILEKNPLPVIKYLLDQGNDVNKMTHDSRNYLLWAGYKGDVPLMKYLVEKGSDIRLIDSHGNNLLFFVSSTGQDDLAVYDYIKSIGYDLPNERDSRGRTALMAYVSRAGNKAVIDYMAKEGILLNEVDHRGNGLLFHAARTVDSGLLSYLKDLGAPNMEKGKENENAFHFASHNTSLSIEFCEYLQRMGQDPSLVSTEGKSALHNLAWRHADKEVFDYFLNSGIDVNIKDQNGQTALMNAASRNKLEIVEFLIKRGADVQLKDIERNTAIMNAIKTNSAEVAQLLLEKGSDPNVRDKHGNGLIHHLVHSSSSGNVEEAMKKLDLLLRTNTSLSDTNAEGQNALHIAATKDNVELITKLIPLIEDPNLKDKNGLSALHHAAMKASNPEILRILVERGADIHLKTDFEESPYELALENELMKKSLDSLKFLKG